MALASVQGSAEASAYAADGYLLEIYQQVAETTRPVATPRYARLAAFLAFVGLVTAAFAVLVSLPEDGGGPVIPQLCMALGVIGLLVAVAFSAQEARAVRVPREAATRGAAIHPGHHLAGQRLAGGHGVA